VLQSRHLLTGALVLTLLAMASLPTAQAKSSEQVTILQFSDQPLDHRATWNGVVDTAGNYGDPDETLGGDGRPSGILVPDPPSDNDDGKQRNGQSVTSWLNRLWGFVMALQWR